MAAEAESDVEAQFQSSRSAHFREREGGAVQDGQKPKVFSNKKLCFTATRRELLARHLLRLSERDDCVYVKYSVHPRDGMYLGRCFLSTEAAVGDVWARYKLHPSLFCTIQDDEFTTAFREASDYYEGLWLDDDRTIEERDTLLFEDAPP